jgi:hypothetical protein
MPRKRNAYYKMKKKAKGKEKQMAGAKKRQEIIEAQIEQLDIHSLPLPVPQMEKGNNNYAIKKCCSHGFKLHDVICQRFVKEFLALFTAAIESDDNDDDDDEVAHCYTKLALEATAAKYSSSIFTNKSRLEKIASYFVCKGTQLYLDGEMTTACLHACLACYFEQSVSMIVHYNTPTSIDAQMMYELQLADEHTLVSFFRRRITCKCLDTKYKQVKSLPKMGRCCNDGCSLPEGHVQRSKMFYCTGCYEACYCSHECQKDDWKEHKQCCKEYRRLNKGHILRG